MTVAVLDPLEDGRWGEFVDTAPGALVFHTPAWLGLLHRQYGYEVSAWCVQGDGGEIVAGLPVARVRSRLTGTRLVAVPFADVCGPLGPPGGQEALLAAVLRERERAGLDLEVHDEVPLAGGQPSQRFLHHAVPLAEDPAEVEAGFTKSQVKRGIKRAAKLGLQVERRTDEAALDAFYALHLSTRRRQGTPIQPKRFIRRFAGLFERNLGFVALVGDGDGPPAAGAVFLTYRGSVTYKYGASDRARLRERPNNLLFWEVIRWACEQGYKELDMGRTNLDNQGLREFKLAWGARERELAYTKLSAKPVREGSDTPRPVQALLRRSPPIVSRVVGETLYRHFA